MFIHAKYGKIMTITNKAMRQLKETVRKTRRHCRKGLTG